MTITQSDGVITRASTVYADENAPPVPDNPGNHIGSCSVTDIPACLSRVIYIIPYSLGYWALGLSAKMLDATAAITLSSNIYTKATFISDGWRLTRDLSNIFFIIILLYVALALILGLSIGHANPKGVLATLVAVAIFLNFSLLITQVVIDVSNSLALVFYNQISIVKDGEVTALTNLPSDTVYGEKTRPISVALANSFRPHVLASTEFYNCLSEGMGSMDTKCSISGKTTNYAGNAGEIPDTVMIPLLIVMGMLFLVAAYSFFVVSLAFIGRVIGLWVSVIFAPFAFATYIIPTTRGMKGFGWNEWISTLIKTAFAAPIYFFFMLLISLLAQSDFAKIEGSTVGEVLIISIISVLLLLTLLLRATKFAREASGVIGEMVTKLGVGAAKFVGGAAIGVGAGAAAIAGRSTVGLVASKIGQSNSLRNAAAGEGLRGPKWMQKAQQWTAQRALVGAQNTGKASFDVRQNGLANLISAKAGINMGSIGAFSTKNTAGGWEGAVARQTAKDMKWKERLGYDKKKEKEIKEDKEKRSREVEEAERRLNAVKAGGSNDDTYKEQLKVARQNLARAQATGNQANIQAAQTQLNTVQENYKNDTNTIKNAQAKLDKLKFGDKMGTRKAGDAIYDENGRETGRHDEASATAWNERAKIHDNQKENLGLKDFEKAEENVKLGRFKQYLYTKAQDSGYHVGDEKKDAYGNLTTFHVDSKQRGSRNWFRAMGTTLMAGGLAGLASNLIAPGLGTAIGMAAGVGAANAFREVMAEVLGGGAMGSKLSHAEGVHHSMDSLVGKDKGDHGNEAHSKYHPGGGGILDELFKVFTSSGGGKSSGGGGGSGHSHGH